MGPSVTVVQVDVRGVEGLVDVELIALAYSDPSSLSEEVWRVAESSGRSPAAP